MGSCLNKCMLLFRFQLGNVVLSRLGLGLPVMTSHFRSIMCSHCLFLRKQDVSYFTSSSPACTPFALLSIAGIPPGKSDASGGIWPKNLLPVFSPASHPLPFALSCAQYSPSFLFLLLDAFFSFTPPYFITSPSHQVYLHFAFSFFWPSYPRCL